jgi:hypothetical protein
MADTVTSSPTGEDQLADAHRRGVEEVDQPDSSRPATANDSTIS